MGKRQREWASRKRLELIDLLGGKCLSCGSKEKLEFDHVNNSLRDWEAAKLDQSSRMSKYWQDYKNGNIQLLCEMCNRTKPKGMDYRLMNKEGDPF